MGKTEGDCTQPDKRLRFRKVRFIIAIFALGGLSLAVLVVATVQTLSDQLHALDIQPESVVLDASSSREVALLTIRGAASGWALPHKLSLTEDSHCDVFANKDDPRVASLQLVGLEEDGEVMTLQMEVVHGSTEEVQARMKRAGDFLLNCRLHFDVNVFNTGFFFKMEQGIQKGDKMVSAGDTTKSQDAPAPSEVNANASTAGPPAPPPPPHVGMPRFNLVRKTWEISKPSLPDFKTVAEAAYFAEIDIPHGQLEGVTWFFEHVAVHVKVDADYFVERSPTYQVGVIMDGPVVAHRGDTSTVISIPARVNMKLDAEAVNNLASAVVSGHLQNGVRKSPEGRTMPCSKILLLSKAPSSAVARLSGASHEIDLVTEGAVTRQDVLDAGRRLLPRRLGQDDEKMPMEDKGFELTFRLFVDDFAFFRADINTTKELKLAVLMREPGKSVTNVVQVDGLSKSNDHHVGIFVYDTQMTPDVTPDAGWFSGGLGPRWSMDTPVMQFKGEVTDRLAQVWLLDDTTFTLANALANVQVDATWQDLLDTVSDWFHHGDRRTSSQDSLRLLESQPGKPYVVNINATLRVELRRSMQTKFKISTGMWPTAYFGEPGFTDYRDMLELSWVQNFSRDWKSFGNIALEVREGKVKKFNEYLIGALHSVTGGTSGNVTVTPWVTTAPLVHPTFKFASALEFDYSSADVLKVSGHTDMLATCPSNAETFEVMKSYSDHFNNPAAPTALDNAKCGTCRARDYMGNEDERTTYYYSSRQPPYSEVYELSCPNPSEATSRFWRDDGEISGWPVTVHSCCEGNGNYFVETVIRHFSLTVGDTKTHSFNVEFPLTGNYERTESQASYGLLEVGSGETTDLTGSVTVVLDNLMDMMANGPSSMTMPQLHDPWRQDSTIRYLLNNTFDFMGYQVVLLDMLDAMGMTVVLDESHLKTFERWVGNVMTRTIELTVSELQILFETTNYTADDRDVLVQAHFKGESKYYATFSQSRDVAAQKTTVRCHQVTRDGNDMSDVVVEANVSDLPMDMKHWAASLMDMKTNEETLGLTAFTGHGFTNGSASVNGDHLGDLIVTWTDGQVPDLNNLTVSVTDKDQKNLMLVIDADSSQADTTTFGLNFSDAILSKHDGAFSLHSMKNYLTVYGALADKESTGSSEESKKSFDFAFSKVGLLSSHFKLKDGLKERVSYQIVESAVGEQKIFDLMHADDMLTNTNSTVRFTTGGPSALDTTIALSYTTTTTTTMDYYNYYPYNPPYNYYYTTTPYNYSYNYYNDTTTQPQTTTQADTTTTTQLMTTELHLLLIEAKGSEPAVAQFNVTEESIQTFGVWVSGKQADGAMMGDFGFMTADKHSTTPSEQFGASRLEAGNGKLYLDFTATGKDGLDKMFLCNASEISGGLDSLVLLKDKGRERFRLATKFGDAPGVSEQKVFDLMHKDDFLTNTNSTVRFTTGGPSALDGSIALSYTTTTTTTTLAWWQYTNPYYNYYDSTTPYNYSSNYETTTQADTTTTQPNTIAQLMTTELKLLLIEAKGSEPAVAHFNVTEETIQTFGVWVSGKEADGTVMGDFGFMTADKHSTTPSEQFGASRLEAGNGKLHLDFTATGKDGLDKMFLCNASEISGGADGLVLLKDKGNERFKLAFKFGDTPGVAEQKEFGLTHADDFLTNTNWTVRFTTGGPSALDATMAVSYTTTTTTTRYDYYGGWQDPARTLTTTTDPYYHPHDSSRLMTTELKLLLVEAKGSEPAVAQFNVTEEITQTFGVWVSGKKADGVVTGTFGFMTADKFSVSPSEQFGASRLEVGNGIFHVDFTATGKDGLDLMLLGNASEISGGLDSLVLFKDKGKEKFKLAFKFGDTPGATDSTDKLLHWQLATDAKKFLFLVDYMKGNGQLMAEAITEDVIDERVRRELWLHVNAKEVDGGFDSRVTCQYTPTTTTTTLYNNYHPYPIYPPYYTTTTMQDQSMTSTTISIDYASPNDMDFMTEFNISTANIGFLLQSSKFSDAHAMVARTSPKQFVFSIPKESIWVNFTEVSTDLLTGSASLRDLGSLSGTVYHSHHTAMMMESKDNDGNLNFHFTTFLSGVEEDFRLANLKLLRRDAAKHDNVGFSWYSPTSSSTSSSRLLAAGSSTTRWSDMFPASAATDFSHAESMLHSEAPAWKASVPANFSGVRAATSAAIENFNVMGNLLWEEGAGLMVSAIAYDRDVLKLNVTVDTMPTRTPSFPPLPPTTTSMLVETTTTALPTTALPTTALPTADGTTTLMTTTLMTTTLMTTTPTPPTPAPPPPPPPPKVVVQIELKMEDVSQFNQAALEASLNSELTKSGENAEIKIVQVDYTVKVEYTFASTISEAEIKQALANLHGVSISQISITVQRRLAEDAANYFRRLTSNALEAAILTSDPAIATAVKAEASNTTMLATELTTITGQQVAAPEVSAAPATAVEVVTEIISNEPVSSDGGTPAPPLLSQSAMSQIVTSAAQDSGLNAQVTVEEPMIVTQTATSTTTATAATTGMPDATTITTTTIGGTDTTTTFAGNVPDSHCAQVKFGLSIALLFFNWAA